MYIKRTNKKIIHICCEGKSEKNYFEALRRNKIVLSNYVLKLNTNENDLENAIKKSERLEGVGIIRIYIFDSDSYKNRKKITQKIEKYKDSIYFSEKNFEGFLACHKTKPFYRDRKPNLSRHLIEEIKNLDIDFIKKHVKKSNKFKDFKSIYELLQELFEQKL